MTEMIDDVVNGREIETSRIRRQNYDFSNFGFGNSDARVWFRFRQGNTMMADDYECIGRGLSIPFIRV